MSLAKPQIDAVRTFGYSEQESRFLYLVVTHSGYFVLRQFLGFASPDRGKRTTRLGQKLQANRHAQMFRLAEVGTIYHLVSRTLYRQMGHENPGDCREHEFEYISRRIATLDFVLGNLANAYLESEPDKVAYFRSELNVPEHDLPTKTYCGRQAKEPTVRRFADHFPVFFPPAPAPRVVTFTYIQVSEANLAGFAHHLRCYLALFRQLSEFRFLFLARTQTHFMKARELFRALVTIPLESNPADDLLRYFTIRKAWELAEYSSVSEADLIFRNLVRERFSGTRFDAFYRAWKIGRVSEAKIRQELRGSDKPHAIHFETQILEPVGPKARCEEKR